MTGEEEPVGKCAGVPRFTAAMLPLHSSARNCSASRLFPWDSYLPARTQTEESDPSFFQVGPAHDVSGRRTIA